MPKRKNTTAKEKTESTKKTKASNNERIEYILENRYPKKLTQIDMVNYLINQDSEREAFGEFPDSTVGSMLFSELSEKYSLDESLVKNGDALYFSEYRGVGLWIVEEFTNEKNEKVKMIHKVN